jgi:organic hydroperoxide reductase OsmC/OhrA
MVQFAPLYDVEIFDLDVDLRVEFDDADKYDLPGPGAAFQKVVYRLKVKSPSNKEQVEKLIAHAERGCHTAQSLRNPVSVSLETEIIPVTE